MWKDFASAAHDIGGLTALGLVCLLQYVWHAYSQRRLQSERDWFRDSLQAAETELAGVQTQSQGAQLENQLLCNLLAEPSSDIALRRLLQSFISINTPGVAAHFTRGETWTLHDAVGIDRRQGTELTLDPPVLAALSQSTHVVLTAAELETSALGRALQSASGGRLERLYLFRTSPTSEPLDGVVLTSNLPDGAGSEADRVRIVERLLTAAGRYFQRSAVAAAQEQELRMTREILELRSVVDLEFGSPQEMVQQFLDRLVAVCEFDFAAVYLLRRKDFVLTKLSSTHRVAARSELAHWETAALAISQSSLAAEQLQSHSEAALLRVTPTAPFRSAITVPMRVADEAAGLLCLCGLRPAALSEADRELLVWSAEYLLETILRTVDRATIEARASRDALTGLANRHAFDVALEEHLDRSMRTHRECALILVDLDCFKQINDRYGHPAGDEVLRTVARLIQDEVRLHVRGSDHPLAARYGGEELAVILPHVGLAGALRVAERLRQRIAETKVDIGGGDVQVTLSAGVAVAPSQANTAEALVIAADEALYAAKAGGRNRVRAADPLATVTTTRSIGEAHQQTMSYGAVEVESPA